MRSVRDIVWKPWHVAVALAIVGVIGASAVMWAARSIDSIDRADIETWEAFLIPRMDQVMSSHADLSALGGRADAGDGEDALDGDLSAVRRKLQALRRPLQEHRYAEITIPATGRYLTALGETLAALAVIENALASDVWSEQRGAFSVRIKAASAAYAEGEIARDRLRARARLPLRSS